MAETDDERVAALAAALMRVSRGLERSRRSIPDAARLGALQVIAAMQPVRPSAVAAELEIHQSLATRQVQALNEVGHVVVEQDPDDGRGILVRTTAAGEEELRRLQAIGIARFTLFVDGWEAEEVTELTRLLTKFEQGTAEHGKSLPGAAQRDTAGR